MNKYLLQAVAQQGSLLNLDANAKAFIEAAAITDAAQKSAINTFVKDLKAINAVQADFVNFDTPANSICKAIYPVVGGSAASHKLNLINPADSDAAFRLTLSATGMTHDAKGINNATGYINTNLNTNLLGADSHGADVMINGGSATSSKWALINQGAEYIYIQMPGGLSNDITAKASDNGKQIVSVKKNAYSSSGLFSINRRSQLAADGEFYSSGIKIQSAANATANLNASNISLLSLGTGYNVETTLSYAAIRKAGSSEAVVALYIAAILKFQNALNRLQKKNIVFEGHSFFDNQGGSNSFNWAAEQTIIKLNATYANRIYRYVSSAISGSKVSDLVARKATAVDPYYISEYGMKNIMPLWIGTNDVTATVGSGAATYAEYKSLYNSYVANGWKVIAITMTELLSGTGQREAERVIFNNLIRTDLAPQYLIDTDLIPELADSDNTTYYNADKIHLVSAGNNIISTALANLIASI